MYVDLSSVSLMTRQLQATAKQSRRSHVSSLKKGEELDWSVGVFCIPNSQASDSLIDMCIFFYKIRIRAWEMIKPLPPGGPEFNP